jgi:hypothetical protein
MRLRTFLLSALSALATAAAAQCGMPDRFGLDSAATRLIDNMGEGCPELPALRNMRVILKNVAYRGGVENLQGEVGVMHPLGITAIKGLADHGFDRSEYLYSRRFEEQYDSARLDSLAKAGFSYACTPELEDADVLRILQDVHQRATSPMPRPVYYHCWNGRHQSGMLSAMILMQFCGLTNEQGLAYWHECTNGDDKGYHKVKDRVASFQRFPQLELDAITRSRVCPCMSETVLRGRALPTPVGHTVSRGETLGSIAACHDIPLERLLKANKLTSSSTIKPGQQLAIPPR